MNIVLANHGPNPFGRTHGPYNVRDLTTAQKMWIARDYTSGKKDYPDILKTYGVLTETAKKWVKRVRKGHICHDKGGRPRCVDADAVQNLIESVSERKYLVRETDWDKTFQAAVDATAEKRGVESKTCCKKTIRAYEKENNIKTGNAETTTDARAVACADVVNFITFAAMNWLFVEKRHVPPQLILNIDATQYKVGSDSSQNVKVKKIGPIEGPLKALPKAGDNTNGVAYFIKHFLFINAMGDMLDPVYVVADDSMKEDTFHPYHIKGLGVGTQAAAPAWLVFCKTRCGNVEFFKWLNEKVIIPSVEKLRADYDLEHHEAWE